MSDHQPVPYAIRRMARGDLHAVHALERMCFPTPWPLKSFEYELEQNPASHQWVMFRQGADGAEQDIVGMLVAWLLVDEIHIANLSVHPDHRRQRIASRLIYTALQELEERGAVSATLEVREGNHAAQHLYRRFGFQLVGRRPGYYQDSGEDAILMTLFDLDKDHLNIISHYAR